MEWWRVVQYSLSGRKCPGLTCDINIASKPVKKYAVGLGPPLPPLPWVSFFKRCWTCWMLPKKVWCFLDKKILYHFFSDLFLSKSLHSALGRLKLIVCFGSKYFQNSTREGENTAQTSEKSTGLFHCYLAFLGKWVCVFFHSSLENCTRALMQNT